MPLHEYLEQKRRQNISALNASGACHICGSTCRNIQGFRHFLDHETVDGNNNGNGAAASASAGSAAAAAAGRGGMYNENSMVRPPDLAPMRTCACFGQSPSDPDYWPYSLRVCDKCIEDDAGIGRIRNCGICGTVACDENCGAELLECTDLPEWNNAGCIECRRLADFSEMDIFRQPPPAQNKGEMRITRICTKCLEQSTPWVRYDFVCRRFRCETRLVPSDIAERKRFRTFGSSPLNLLPEDGLVAVVDFLSGKDLKHLFLTCSAMCTVAERVAKEKVCRVHDQFPTGPITTIKRKQDGHGPVKDWTHLSGRNDFGLRAPDDDKAWVGVYHYLEQMTKEMFYFGFQMTGRLMTEGDVEPGDAEVVGRFLNKRSEEKFTFGTAYRKVENELIEWNNVVGMSIRGGCLHVPEAWAEVDHEVSIANPNPPIVVAGNQRLESGIHRILIRIFCPGTGAAQRANRDNVTSSNIGSVGILRTNQRIVTEGSPANGWAQRQDIKEGWLKEHVVVGLCYNADTRELIVHSNANINRSSRHISHRYTISAETAGDLYFGAELTAHATGVPQTLLTARYVDEDEWTMFVDHTTHAGTLANNNDPLDILTRRADGARFMRERGAILAMRERDRARAANGAEADDDVIEILEPMDERIANMEAMEADLMANGVENENANNLQAGAQWRNRRRERDEANMDDDAEGGNQRLQARMEMADGRRVARMIPPRQRRYENANDAPVARQQRQPQRQERDEADQPMQQGNVARGRRMVRAVRPLGQAAVMEEELDENFDDSSVFSRSTLGFDDGLLDVDEEVAAGEFVRQIEIAQPWPDQENAQR